MKCLFKVKYKIELDDIFHNKYLTLDEAYEIYKHPVKYIEKGYCKVHIPCGFFARALNFSEWLDYYKIKII